MKFYTDKPEWVQNVHSRVFTEGSWRRQGKIVGNRTTHTEKIELQNQHAHHSHISTLFLPGLKNNI